ncbi:unnamed protein product [Blepharisma stoltei]|uniref:Uncharacterized protein n=1 Tax=Blepharisma stoltei TaxID=1481888 RepID=A0AAU9IRS3_9CILI|nr:unnamed protein product [Blepharisma stoltei]
MNEIEKWRAQQQKEKNYQKEIEPRDSYRNIAQSIFNEKSDFNYSQKNLRASQEIKNPYTRSYMQNYLKRQKEKSAEDIFPDYQRIPEFLNEFTPSKRPESPIDYVPQKEREIDKEFLKSTYQNLKTDASRLIQELQKKQQEEDRELNALLAQEYESSSEHLLDEESSEELGFTLSKPLNTKPEEVYTETFYELDEQPVNENALSYEKFSYKNTESSDKKKEKKLEIDRNQEVNYFTFDQKVEPPKKVEPFTKVEEKIEKLNKTEVQNNVKTEKKLTKTHMKSTSSIHLSTKSIDIQADFPIEEANYPQKSSREPSRQETPRESLPYFGVQVVPVYQYMPPPVMMQYPYPYYPPQFMQPQYMNYPPQMPQPHMFSNQIMPNPSYVNQVKEQNPQISRVTSSQQFEFTETVKKTAPKQQVPEKRPSSAAVKKREVLKYEKPRTPMPFSPREPVTKRSVTPLSRSPCISPKTARPSLAEKTSLNTSRSYTKTPIEDDINAPAEAWDIKFSAPQKSIGNKQQEFLERLQKRSLTNKTTSKKETKTKEELQQIRKEMLKPKIVKKPQNEMIVELNVKESPNKGPNPELLKRLASGEKPKVTREEMKRLTAKHYSKLPEVKKKQEEDLKRQELILRLEKAKAYDKNRHMQRKLKDN